MLWKSAKRQRLEYPEHRWNVPLATKDVYLPNCESAEQELYQRDFPGFVLDESDINCC